MRRRTTLIVLFILLLLPLNGKEKFLSHNGGFYSRVVIVVDSKSYDALTLELHAYRRAIEESGVGAALLIGDWDNPDQLRKSLAKIYKKRPILEGVIFVGDIPIVRVVNFQHATTAFKMDESTFPIEEHSVTSDRFYDDLNLQFRFLKRDEKNSRHFYYALKEESPQLVQSQFYSSRILPPSTLGEESYPLLKRYLEKVVRAHKENNYLDNVIFFNGSGYNSDCLTAWHNQQFAIAEQLPEAFKSSRGNAFYNFRQYPFMRYKLYERMQKQGTDLFVFHEHGAYDTQYISGPYRAPNLIGKNSSGHYGPMEALSISLRNGARRYKGERREEFEKSALERYNLLPSFFDSKIMESTKVEDSLFAAGANIKLNDLESLKPQPRLSIFDACYNGSFHRPGYVAGYHLFLEGETIVTQGNTVNSLQDRWSMELLGMLAEGVRVGLWHKEVQTLETHLMGDPTYSFTPGSRGGERRLDAIALNRNLATQQGNNRVWLEYLKSDNPNYQAIALKQLSYNPPAGYDTLLLHYLKESPFYSVRMEALQRVLYSSPKYIVEALLLALDDPYELIRRNGARFSSYCGDERLLAPLINTVIFSDESKRVQYAAHSALPMFSIEKIEEEVRKQVANSHLEDKEELIAHILGYYNSQENRSKVRLATIKDESANEQERLLAIRNLRNYNNHLQVPQLLEVLKESSNTTVRVTLAEALGWFRWSVKRVEILKALQNLYKEKSLPQELRGEIHQSIIRLSSTTYHRLR
ncbi:MAG: hypothetical protein WC960_00915 [Bacteroidales bacterium]